MDKNDSIQIKVEQNPAMRCYQEILQTNMPVFEKGNDVSGLIKVNFGFDLINHRGIEASICSFVMKGDVIFEKKVIVKQIILENGRVEGIYSSRFCFEAPKIIEPSYEGKEFSHTYAVVVTLTRLLRSSINAHLPIVFVAPQEIPKNPSLPITLTFNVPFLQAQLHISESHFSTTSIIEGQLIIDKAKPDQVDSIIINLSVLETYKGNEKQHKLLNYQLSDGIPRAPAAIPFSFDLAMTNIWATIQSPLKSEYILTAIAVNGNSLTYSDSKPISVFLKKMP